MRLSIIRQTAAIRSCTTPDLSESLNPVKEIADTMKLVVLRRQAEGDFASPWASCYS